MTKRISKKVVSGVNITQFEEALSQYAAADKRESEILSKINADTTRINDTYKDELNYLDEKKKGTIEIIQTYCSEQKQTLFNKRRTLHTLYGAVGFRLGNPRLKIPRSISQSKLLQLLKEQMPQYVRVTEEPAKDLIIADRAKEPVAALLQNTGLQVVQEEIFFVELKPLVSNIN